MGTGTGLGSQIQNIAKLDTTVQNFVLRLDFIELLLLITPKQNNYLFLSKKYVILNAFFFFGSFCMGGGGIKNMEN